MAEADLIPAGRTSRINKEGCEIQIQTEYAYRPAPRLTTSVIQAGQVIHKIQENLDKSISNIDEKIKIERLLQKQHFEILQVVKGDDFTLDLMKKEKPIQDKNPLSMADKLSQIGGVVNVFRIDNEGNFDSANVSTKFKKYFKAIFKNTRKIIDIFNQLPGGKRETGVVEVERRRLYLVSCGAECYFILMDGLNPGSIVESAIKETLYS
jgi:hypothetical protein